MSPPPAGGRTTPTPGREQVHHATLVTVFEADRLNLLRQPGGPRSRRSAHSGPAVASSVSPATRTSHRRPTALTFAAPVRHYRYPPRQRCLRPSYRAPRAAGDLHDQRIELDVRIQRVQRPSLPCLDLLRHRIGGRSRGTAVSLRARPQHWRRRSHHANREKGVDRGSRGRVLFRITTLVQDAEPRIEAPMQLLRSEAL